MDQLVIEAKVRSETGKKAAKAIRAAGLIPAVVYDEAGKATSITVNAVQFNKVWRSITSTTLVTLDVEGKKYDAFIRDTEYNIMTDSVLHADFFAVSNTKPVIRSYKVQYQGTPAGVLKGGFMVKHVPEVKVKALPKDLPVRVVIDVSGVNIGDVFRVKDMGLGDKVTVLTNPEDSLVSVAPAR
ncbi:50S ribosomal protein L25 [uncultured Treponema sp.]|uniref:50S ribosomal protein L25 n=1 Tax=uncultured Treponema sp. TaxID=162155 RepID=UPI0025F4DE15|nr:50S ribosomal protein L25 [uncultured Treponema sp.]